MMLQNTPSEKAKSAPTLIPQDIKKWQSFVEAQISNPIEFNMTRPQRSFRYPDYALLPPEFQNQSLAAAKDRLRVDNLDPKFFSDTPQAIQFCLKTFEIKSVASLGPISSSYFVNNERVEQIPRDPDLWETFHFHSHQAVYISNPNLEDGFFLTEDFLMNFYNTVRQKNPKLVILCDESMRMANFSKHDAASLKNFLVDDARLIVIESVYPVLCPTGPLHSWIYNKEIAALKIPEFFVAEDIEWSARAIFCFSEKNSGSFLEYKRRMIATFESLKIVSSYLNTPLYDQILRVPYWPDAGFFLNIDVSPWLKANNFIDSKEGALKLAQRHGVLVNPGTLHGQPNFIQICFATSNPYMDKFGRILGEALKIG